MNATFDPGEPVVIVGAGQAGSELAVELRMRGHNGSVTLIGDEATLPYTRPPLSKAFLLGEVTLGDLHIRPGNTYIEHDIFVTDAKAIAIDRPNRLLMLSDGASLPYGGLVLATGGRPRRLPMVGLDAASNVHYLKTVVDAQALRDQLVPGARLVIIGGGYVGLEVAAVARQLGVQVSVLEVQQRVLARVTALPVSVFYQRIHAEEGVEIRLGVQVEGFEFSGKGCVTAIRLTSGERMYCDLVLIGIGQTPNFELAASAGLAVNDGVVVDAYCRTDDPRILAIGDCSRHPCSEHGGLRRLESVDNALQQARIAAATLMNLLEPYQSVPWFWSDQYGTRLQAVGVAAGYDEVVVRGDPNTGRSFSVLYLKCGAVRAADVISNPREFAAARKLVAHRAVVSPTLLADPAVPLNYLATQLSQSSKTIK